MKNSLFLLTALAVIPFSAGVLRAESSGELRDDLVTVATNRANCFAAELARSEGARGAPNVVVCPAAVRSCLGVATLFAAGETRAGLAKAAHLPADRRGLEVEAFASRHVFSGYREEFEETELFLDADTLKLKPGYEAWLLRYLGVAPKSVSFADPAEALAVMEGRSGDMRTGRSSHGEPLPLPFSVADIAAARDSKTGMFLVSRSHFNSRWDKRFREELTREEVFHADGGRTVPVAMMHLVEDLPCAKLPGALAVRLAFNATSATIYLILPDEKMPANERMSLLPDDLFAFAEKFTKHHATVSLPRFRITHRTNIPGFLKTSGAGKALDRLGSDFSGGLESVRVGEKPALGDIRQEAYLKIDEAGAEAGSVSGMSFSSLFGAVTPPEYPKMTLRFDRPFIFVIERDGAVLFAGRCGEPAGLPGVERDKLALNRVADAITALAASRFAAGATGLTGQDVLPLLKLPDGRPVFFEWSAGGEIREFGGDKITPGAAFDADLDYALRISGEPGAGLKIKRRLPSAPSKKISEDPVSSEG